MARIGGTVGLQDLRRRGSGTNTQSAWDRAASRSARESMTSVISSYAKLIQYTRNILPECLEDALRPTFEKSQVYVPKKTGTLARSGKLITGYKGVRAHAEISYGNEGEVHYAALVHEFTELNHQEPTRAKYLQSAMEEDLGEFKERVISAIRDKM